MTLMLERTATYRTLITRWHGHGDLTVKVNDRDTVYLRADQVEALAAIAPWGNGEQLLDADWHDIDGVPFYTLDMAVARCESDAGDTAAAFLTWLDDELRTLLVDEVLDDANKVPGFLGSYPVKRAAEILDRDPQITIGQHGLFRHLERVAWIQRDHADEPWKPTQYATRNGWVTVRAIQISVGAHKQQPYPQVYITPAGLTALRGTLQALNPTTPELEHPTLFD